MATISAEVICDSVSHHGIRITTLQLRYPKFIHGEFMTHRVFSRNASSSRAVPVERLIADVERDPVVPLSWGRNRKGMQAGEEHDATVRLRDDAGEELVFRRQDAWLEARDQMIRVARAYAEAGYHKQVVNRLLEPFCHINVVVTATEWANFFALRRHEDAEPHIRMLAERMWEAMQTSTPLTLYPGQWHLPYVDAATHQQIDDYFRRCWVEQTGEQADTMPLSEHDAEGRQVALKCSVARCARVSYLTHDGRASTVEQDLELYERLVGAHPMHVSPAEHQATPNRQQPHLHGNFRGWVQYRKTLPDECATEVQGDA